MTPEKYQRLKPLFEQALDTPPAQRADFILTIRMADDELGRELESLIESHTGESHSAGTHGSESGEETKSIDTPLVRFNHLFPSEPPSFGPKEMLLDRFRIVRFIGKGGMGEVYEAEDMHLGRVAIKTIRTDLAGRPEILARFRQEVQLARRVANPAVCRIHELFPLPSGDRRGAAAFLTMEYLEGITLAERLDRDGALPVPEAESIALQLCAAVQAIHDAGVLHRDIKSRNIMLVPRNGATQVVVMDLGLAGEVAKGSDAEGSDNDTGLTMAGAVMGTRAYMAPELFAGARATPASDVFALAVVLYEMVTGKLPPEVLKTRPAPPASSLRNDLPKQWDRVVGRCLEYEREKRWASAQEVAGALQGRQPLRMHPVALYAAGAVLLATVGGIAGSYIIRDSGRPANAAPKHLAVLPFANIGNDPANLVTSDGLLETLTSRLSSLDASGNALWVVPASEVRQRKVTEPRDAVKQLGVNYVVTGSVQRDQKGVRLTVNLVDPRNVRQIGSVVISESDGDYSALEDGAVVKLAELLRIDGQPGGSDQHPRASPAAYQQYLEAMGYLHRWDQQGSLDKAIALFGQVSQEDPKFHLSLAGLSEAYRLRYTLDHNQKWVDLALQAANSALAADSKLEPVYVTLGKVHNNTGQYTLAMEEFERALNLSPRDADAIQGMAETYQGLGRIQEAEATFHRAIALRPDSWEGYFRLGNFYYTLSRFREAESQYRRVLELAPDNMPALTNLGTVLTNENRYEEARTVLEKAVALNPTYSAYNNLASVDFLEGRYPDAAAVYEQSLRLNDTDYEVWANLAAACAAAPALASRSRAAFEKAASLAEQKAKETPDAGVQSELGSYYAHLKMPGKARFRLEAAVALAPEDPNVVLTIAEGYATLNDRAAAKLYLQKALKLGASPEYAKRIPALKDSFN